MFWVLCITTLVLTCDLLVVHVSGLKSRNTGRLYINPALRSMSSVTPDGARLPVRNFSTYLPIISVSMFTLSPGLRRPSVVTLSVCGITATLKPGIVHRGDRQADAVDGDRALFDNIAQDLARGFEANLSRISQRRMLSSTPTPST